MCGGAERTGDVVEHRFGDGHGQGNDARQVSAGVECVHACLLMLERMCDSNAR